MRILAGLWRGRPRVPILSGPAGLYPLRVLRGADL